MAVQRCYICRRSAEEIAECLRTSSDFEETVAATLRRDRAEWESSMEEIEQAVERGDLGFLRGKRLEGLLCTEGFLKKFGGWDRDKLEAAMKCDYPFGDGERELIESLLPRLDTPGKRSLTVKDVHDDASKRYEQLDEDEPMEIPEDVQPSDVYEVTFEQRSVFSLGNPNWKAGLRRARTLYVSVPICSVCEAIMADIAADCAPTCVRDDSFYSRG